MKAIYAIIALIILGAAGLFYYTGQLKQVMQPGSSSQTQSDNSSQNQEQAGSAHLAFDNPKKSAHYETNTPSHGATLAGIPINVVIDFNFDLAPPSDIKIQQDGKDYGVGETVIDPNKLAMRRDMDPNSPDGRYTVLYNACWPDGSCHDGHFQFSIDISLSQGFDDRTGKDEITINMSEIMFKPKDIKVSKGTKITWVNDEGVEHYVNTDSHPAHTYYKEQNSKVLGKGDKYSITFDTAGIYPYHCSAHEAQMKGNILVE